MTEKSEKGKSREWYGTTKTWWQQLAGSSGGQSFHDAWDHSKPKGKWKEVSAEFETVNALVKEKKITWNKSGRESAKREADWFSMIESAARDKLGDRLEAFLKKERRR